MIKDRIILGIDPGTIVMGYGILKIEGNKPKLEAMGILQLNKYEDHYLRLRKILERTEYVETRKGTRSSDGGGLGAGYPDLRVRPSKNQALDHGEWKCGERTSGRHATTLSEDTGRVYASAIGRYGWVGGGCLSLFPNQ